MTSISKNPIERPLNKANIIAPTIDTPGFHQHTCQLSSEKTKSAVEKVEIISTLLAMCFPKYSFLYFVYSFTVFSSVQYFNHLFRVC